MNCIVWGPKAMQYLAGGKLTIYSRGYFCNTCRYINLPSYGPRTMQYLPAQRNVPFEEE
jgi:hypothetical protein